MEILGVPCALLKEYEEAVKKGVADVMGGKVLQLESERLLAEGAARFAKLVEILLAQDKVEEVKKVASDDKLREEYYTFIILNNQKVKEKTNETTLQRKI